MKKASFYAIISLIITLLVACQPTFQVNVSIEPTPIPNDLGKLAYIQGGDIWVKALPDGEPQRLTQDGNNSEPRWSSSGKWLAFRKGDSSVYLTEESGKATWKLNEGTTVDYFAWSPTIDNMAYASGSEIYTIDADGKNMMQLIPTGEGNQNNETQIGRLLWEPDGSSIAYEWREQPENQPPSGQGIRLISLDGGKPSEIFQGDATLAGWTADGQYLLFWRGFFSSASLAADGLPLFAVSIEGGTPVRVVDIMLTYQDYVSISPTSTDQFLVVSGGGRDAWTNKILMLQRSSGGEGSALTSTDMAVSSPAWSPDVSKIAYVASPDPGGQGMLQGEAAHQALMQRKIFILDKGETSTPTQLTNDAAYRDERPIWSNDSSSILFARFNQQNQASLWLVRVDDGKTTQVVDNLIPTPEWFGYYGHVVWDNLYDWWKGEVSLRPAQSPIPANIATQATTVPSPSPTPVTGVVLTASSTLDPTTLAAQEVAIQYFNAMDIGDYSGAYQLRLPDKLYGKTEAEFVADQEAVGLGAMKLLSIQTLGDWLAAQPPDYHQGSPLVETERCKQFVVKLDIQYLPGFMGADSGGVRNQVVAMVFNTSRWWVREIGTLPDPTYCDRINRGATTNLPMPTETPTSEIVSWKELMNPDLINDVNWTVYSGQLEGKEKGILRNFSLSYPSQWAVTANPSPVHFAVQNVPETVGSSHIEGDFVKLEVVPIKGSLSEPMEGEEQLVQMAGGTGILRTNVIALDQSLQTSLTLEKDGVVYVLAGYANLAKQDQAALDRYRMVLLSMMFSFQIE